MSACMKHDIETCVKEEKYRGLIIYHNINPEFGSGYYSIVNPFIKFKNGKSPHCHSVSLSQSKRIIDCFHRLRKGKPVKGQIAIRAKAMRLLNQYIKLSH